jgi:transcription initiation factor TFIID subunit TAF12
MPCQHEIKHDALDVEWSIEQKVQELLERRGEYFEGFVTGFICAFIFVAFCYFATGLNRA